MAVVNRSIVSCFSFEFFFPILFAAPVALLGDFSKRKGSGGGATDCELNRCGQANRFNFFLSSTFGIYSEILLPALLVLLFVLTFNWGPLITVAHFHFWLIHCFRIPLVVYFLNHWHVLILLYVEDTQERDAAKDDYDYNHKIPLKALEFSLLGFSTHLVAIFLSFIFILLLFKLWFDPRWIQPNTIYFLYHFSRH